eukprot:m.702106 g.702106  ORF g.702106 m.702106 type:complete len:103 (+) comp22914_c0_seq13:820-1128(+)
MIPKRYFSRAALAIDIGVEDLVTNVDGSVSFVCDEQEGETVVQQLMEYAFEPSDAGVRHVPNQWISMQADKHAQLRKLVSALEDYHGVKSVATNGKVNVGHD